MMFSRSRLAFGIPGKLSSVRPHFLPTFHFMQRHLFFGALSVIKRVALGSPIMMYTQSARKHTRCSTCVTQVQH